MAVAELAVERLSSMILAREARFAKIRGDDMLKILDEAALEAKAMGAAIWLERECERIGSDSEEANG